MKVFSYFSCALLLAGLAAAALARKTYDGYQVLRTVPLPETLQPAIHELESDPRFDFWSRPHVGVPVDVMVGPDDVEHLRTVLSRMGLEPSTHIADVGVVVAAERAENENVKRAEKRSARAVTFDRFMEFDEIDAYLREVVAAHPSIASIVNVANSTERRAVHALKISSGPGKKAVWMDCGIHAREWAAPPVCLKTIEEVIASPELRGLVDWYILPVGNPDGYVYTWSSDRMWRKTRRPNAGSSCVGTDPNRNFNFMWNANNNNSPCSETYPGTRAFSEPETAGIDNLVRPLGQAKTIILYLTIHSYGQIFYYPYGTTATPAPNAAALQTAGDIAKNALQAVRGTVYRVFSESSPSGFIYGAMDDYAYDVGTIPYSYTMELPPGGSGFNPPPSHIQPVVNESWAGIQAMVRHIVALSD